MKHPLFVAVIAIFSGIASTVYANDLQRLVDPFGLAPVGAGLSDAGQGMSDLAYSIDLATIRLEALQGELDSDIRDYIEEIDAIIAYAITESSEQLEARIAQAFDRMELLEDKLQRDVLNIIFESECAARRVLTSDFPTAVSNVLERSADGGLKFRGPAGIIWLELEYDEVTSLPPDEAFRRVLHKTLRELQSVDGEFPARSVVSAYTNLAALAVTASCYFPNDTEAKKEYELYRAQLLLMRRPWREIGKVRL